MAQFGQFGRSVTLPTNKKGARVFRLDGTLVGTVWMFDGRLCCSSPRVPITATTTMRSVIRRLRRLAHTDTVGPERPYQGWFYGTKWVCRSCGQPEPTPGYVDPQTRQCSLCEDLVFDFRQDQINKLNEAMSDLRRQAIADAALADYEPTPEEMEFFPIEPDDGGPADESDDWSDAERAMVRKESTQQAFEEFMTDTI